MKTLEKVLATALFLAGGITIIAIFALVLTIQNYHWLVVAVAGLFALLALLSLPYGYVRRVNLARGVSSSRDRNSPPGQFIVLGWGMLIVAIVLAGVSFWLR